VAVGRNCRVCHPGGRIAYGPIGQFGKPRNQLKRSRREGGGAGRRGRWCGSAAVGRYGIFSAPLRNAPMALCCLERRRRCFIVRRWTALNSQAAPDVRAPSVVVVGIFGPLLARFIPLSNGSLSDCPLASRELRYTLAAMNDAIQGATGNRCNQLFALSFRHRPTFKSATCHYAVPAAGATLKGIPSKSSCR